MKRWPYWKTLQGAYALGTASDMFPHDESMRLVAELWYQIALAKERQQSRW